MMNGTDGMDGTNGIYGMNEIDTAIAGDRNRYTAD